MPSHAHFGSETWSLQVWPTLGVLLAAFLYMRGWFSLHSASANSINSRRAGSFLSGLLLIWLAVGSPLASLDMELLTVHMVQHLLLMTFAPPLILLGAPWMAISHGLPRPVSVRFAGLARLPGWLRRFGRVLLHPVFCWLASAATLVAWHIPALFTLAMHSEPLHALEEISFLASGLLFWWPVVQLCSSATMQSGWSIILYLFLATVPCDILSAFLVFSERVAYPVYFSVPRHFGLSVLADQQCAGALMWTCVTVVYLVPAAILTVRLLSPPHGYELAPSESYDVAVAQEDAPGIRVV